MGGSEHRRLVDDYVRCWATGDLSSAEQCCSADLLVVYPGHPTGERGIAALRKLIGQVRQVFPDLWLRVESTVEEGDQLAVRWTAGGTQRGEWVKGIPPTGRPVQWTGMSFYRFADHRIVEERVEEDLLHLVGAVAKVDLRPRPSDSSTAPGG